MHEPLDYSQPSIRLLTISPWLTAGGLIQCSMSHTTIDREPYRCLSYTWGQPEPNQLVLINENRFNVQPNLFEFLKVVRADTARTFHRYWIDALCIDQNNNAERNHQVMQMGRIYSEAEVVVAWLGVGSKETILYYHGDLQLQVEPLLRRYRRKIVYSDLAANPYWTRAWITQELKLARRITFAIGSLTFTIDRLLGMVRGIRFNRYGEVNQILALGGSKQNMLGEPLANLLLTFRHKECSVARDRIFSLLSLCSEKASIKVDYSCSVLELVYSIMRSNAHTLCACSTLIIMQSLAPRIADLTPDESFRYKIGPYMEMDTKETDWVRLGERNDCRVLSYICSRAFTVKEVVTPMGATSCGMQHIKAPTTAPKNACLIDPMEPRNKQPFGSSFVSVGQGLGTIRISLWYLHKLYSEGGLHDKQFRLCSRSWTGTDESMTPIRVGYGNWDINTPGSPEEAGLLKTNVAKC
jgi:hypothetical protein